MAETPKKMELLLERNKFFFLLKIACKCSRFQCKSLQNDSQEKLGLSNVKEWYNLQKINIFFHLKEDAFLDLKSARESQGSSGPSALWVSPGSLVARPTGRALAVSTPLFLQEPADPLSDAGHLGFPWESCSQPNTSAQEIKLRQCFSREQYFKKEKEKQSLIFVNGFFSCPGTHSVTTRPVLHTAASDS